MKKILSLMLVLMSSSFVFSQACWDSIKVKTQNSGCFGGSTGSFEVYYYAGTQKPDKVFVEFYSVSNNTVISSGYTTQTTGLINWTLLKPGSYRITLSYFDNYGIESCRSTFYEVITEPGCDLNINYQNINLDASSPVFLTTTASLTGSFCSEGYNYFWNKKVNGVESYYSSIGSGPLTIKDSVVTGQSLFYSVLPGDTVQFFLDNGNEAMHTTPSSTCRAYSPVNIIPCDLQIDSFSIDLCQTNVRGKIKTMYLPLINNNNYFYGYANNFFTITMHDSVTNNVLGSYKVTDTSGNFTFPTYYLTPGHNYYLKWMLGNCSLKFPFTMPYPSNTWVGAINNNWEVPSNWSCGKVPDADANVIINSGKVVLNSNASCRSLTVNPGTTFTVKSNYTLTVLH